ncbi:MAG TPA: hydrolase [Candidatus Atopostipes pullistercoris]|uniref:Hydrolase n=1 Tax=Candidatus Atopostipes pullistercoris TaxID=2838467 RepID=A0A9D2JYY6_9LACT|nr:hydrolase [Candidatus Atopostipes pullistercoris]
MEFVRKIWENDPEYMTIIKDLLKNEKLLKLEEITHHHYTTRLSHSLFVSYVSYKLAKSRGLDYISTARAGLLHDFFLEGRQDIEKMGLGSHNSAHPKIALKNAQEITEINEVEKDIILKHMFLCTFKGGVPRFKESFIVTLVDKYCAITEVSTPTCEWFKEFYARLQTKVSYS